MLKIIIAIFIILHGLVHLLYLGQSRRLFELQPNLVWPDGSWAFSKLVGDNTTRLLASIFCGLVAIGLLSGSAGIFMGQAWSRPVIVAAVTLSAVGYILLWNGKMQKLDAQGGIGILIDIALLVVVLTIRWPEFEF